MDQRIKGTPGITGSSPPRVHIDGEVWHLDVGSSHPGAVAGPKGWAVRPLKRYAAEVLVRRETVGVIRAVYKFGYLLETPSIRRYSPVTVTPWAVGCDTMGSDNPIGAGNRAGKARRLSSWVRRRRRLVPRRCPKELESRELVGSSCPRSTSAMRIDREVLDLLKGPRGLWTHPGEPSRFS